MKKSKIIGIAAAAVCSASVLAACGGSAGTGGSADASKFAGHWNIKTMEAGGESVDIQALFAAAGSESTDNIGLDLDANGKFSLNIYGDEETSGTWKTSGNDSVVLTIEGENTTATLENGQLVMTHGMGDEELKLYFAK